MKALSLTLSQTRYRDLLIVTMASILIAFAGKMSFTLPFTPVQFTFQNNAILFAGLLLGSRRGFYAVVLLLFQALIGLPVLSVGSTVGLARFLGPTGGYLIAFAISAFVAGWIYENRRTHLGAFVGLSAGLLIQYVIGALWLGHFIGFSNAFLYGVAPFLLGDTLINLSYRCISPVFRKL
ncbi:MAG TPA: biotin transporter BioY [Chlamydiales bacterium]|nr:biotin transporter BioY [Chlamydiales bacterium]HPE85318.1 biotin transporter BioY [Chlamydiales bacterium]